MSPKKLARRLAELNAMGLNVKPLGNNKYLIRGQIVCHLERLNRLCKRLRRIKKSFGQSLS